MLRCRVIAGRLVTDRNRRSQDFSRGRFDTNKRLPELPG
jgi:hypothetical protein